MQQLGEHLAPRIQNEMIAPHELRPLLRLVAVPSAKLVGRGERPRPEVDLRRLFGATPWPQAVAEDTQPVAAGRRSVAAFFGVCVCFCGFLFGVSWCCVGGLCA